MPELPLFPQLEKAVTVIADHRSFPGRLEVIAAFLFDIEQGWRRGRLSPDERSRLYAKLAHATTNPTSHRTAV